MIEVDKFKFHACTRQVFIGLTLFLFTISAQAKECDLKQFLKDNRSVFDSNKPRLTFPNGTSMQNPFFQGKVQSKDMDMGNNSGEKVHTFWRENDLKKMFEEVRGKIRQEISKNGVGAEQRKMLSRLEAVRFGGVSIDKSVLGTNNRIENKIDFSQRLLRLPKLAVIQVLAHELAHTIDQCAMSSAQCRYNHEGDPTKLIKSETSDSEASDLKIKLRAMSSAPGMVDLNPSNEAKFRSKLTSLPFDIDRSNMIPINNNPTTPVINCLNSHYRDYRQQSPDWNSTCRGGGSEPSAQVWAARILGDYMGRKDEHSPEDLLGALAAAQIGNPDTPKGGRLGNKALDFEAIMMSEPSVAKAFGCERTETQKCMDQFNPSAQRAPSAPTLDPTTQ